MLSRFALGFRDILTQLRVQSTVMDVGDDSVSDKSVEKQLLMKARTEIPDTEKWRLLTCLATVVYQLSALLWVSLKRGCGLLSQECGLRSEEYGLYSVVCTVGRGTVQYQ